MCYKKPGPRCASEAKKLMAKAKKSGDLTRIRNAKRQYFMTLEGIALLDSRGQNDLAEQFRRDRDMLIEKYNALNPDRRIPLTPRAGDDPSKFIEKHFNDSGWSRDGVHMLTGTKFDPEGFNVYGRDAEGFDRNGLDRNKCARDGYNPETGLDAQGYDAEGYHHFRDTDRQGYDRDGFKNNIHKATGTNYDPSGFNVYGYHRDTGTHKETGLTFEEMFAQGRQ